MHRHGEGLYSKLQQVKLLIRIMILQKLKFPGCCTILRTFVAGETLLISQYPHLTKRTVVDKYSLTLLDMLSFLSPQRC